MSFFDKIFPWRKNQEDPMYEIDDWNEIVYDRDDLQINDKQQREDYIKGVSNRSQRHLQSWKT